MKKDFLKKTSASIGVGAIIALSVLSPVGFSASANDGIDFASGKVTFTSATNIAIDKGISNGISNLWAGVTLILPYVGTFLGITLLIGVAMMLAKGRGAR